MTERGECGRATREKGVMPVIKKTPLLMRLGSANFTMKESHAKWKVMHENETTKSMWVNFTTNIGVEGIWRAKKVGRRI